jgi:hypothetical protein
MTQISLGYRRNQGPGTWFAALADFVADALDRRLEDNPKSTIRL